MSYRDDLDAAHERIGALEQQVEEKDGVIGELLQANERMQASLRRALFDNSYRREMERERMTLQEHRVFRSLELSTVLAAGISILRNGGVRDVDLVGVVQMIAMIFIIVYAMTWLYDWGKKHSRRLRLRRHSKST